MSGDQAFSGFKYGWLMKGIYGKESSFGKADGCRNSGRVNGFGYGQSTYEWQCFSSFTDVANRVNSWIDSHYTMMTIPTLLCYYNQGKIMDDCSYARDVIALANK